MPAPEKPEIIALTVPAAIAQGHRHLPLAERQRIESQVTRQLLELSVIEQYRRAEIYLSDVAVALGLYPDIEGTMKWLYAHGVPIGPSDAEDLPLQDSSVSKLLRRRIEKAANSGG